MVIKQDTPMITTQNLTRRFGETLAVDSLNLEVYPGEVFGFLGPNGAGKTTTVRMLTALIAPSGGTAFIHGYQIGKHDMDIRRTVGLLTETPGLYDSLSAERNLKIFAQLYDVPDADAAVQKYLGMLGLWERRSDPAGTFSKGMRQKLAIARALLHEPDVLFLDEPTAGLDPEASRLIRDFILELRSLGRTIFLCTHNLDEADRLCDRIGVFKTRLLVVDSPARLRSQIFGRKVVFHLSRLDHGWVDLLAKLPFIEEVAVQNEKIIITLAEPEKYNPEIVRILVNAGADIQFVGELRRSLEDVYLRLMKESN